MKEHIKGTKQSYYVVMPTYLFEDDKIPMKCKKLYGLIVSLCSKKGFCWATNSWLSEKVMVSERTIKRYLKTLIKIDEIICDINQKAGNKRKIWLKRGWEKYGDNSVENSVTKDKYVPTPRDTVKNTNDLTSGQAYDKPCPEYNKEDNKNNIIINNFSDLKREKVRLSKRFSFSNKY